MGETVMIGDPFVIYVEWDVPGLPSPVGPFETREEAQQWGDLNIPNGTWQIHPLTYPYMRTRQAGERAVVAR